MNGKRLRRHESERRRRERYRERQAAAATAHERATVEYDHARGAISRLPEQNRDAAWRDLAGVLERWTAGLTCQIDTAPSQPNGVQRRGTRPRVRQQG